MLCYRFSITDAQWGLGSRIIFVRESASVARSVSPVFSWTLFCGLSELVWVLPSYFQLAARWLSV